MQLPLYNMAGEIQGNIELDDTVFGVMFNEAVVHQALVRQQANSRQGTASTKTRGEVAGSTRKLFRQKHTGNARAGSIKSPLRKGGGITFGPKPRNYRQAMPKAMRQLAIRCVLSTKASDQQLVVLDELKFEAPKTRDMAEVIKALGIEGTALVAIEQPDTNVIKSARNIPSIKTIQARQLNVGDILKYRKLLITESALRQVENLWGRASANGEAKE
ncbi:MAG: 50S ribosomal protein L4 [Dehalococcoidales bacterium]|nr:50S ribosomal protein L4 [Dehalococcoidales bacterium]MDD4229951.1 50S ribosomal protein L4 [Dehalococcoidales bacterium]MDD4465142.1 50S ribosomal protein L4 [Dehalococcoidales bacterium]MDD5401793.1 50S ribosomal protein L4 [Dehalococcoidales bacterium]